MIARVLPDISGLSRVFDYVVPEALLSQVRVGTVVRVPLHGRRVRGWVVAVAEEAETDRPLLPLAKVTGWGPSPELVDLARWAAWRWAGHPTRFLTTASPPVAVRGLPPAPARRPSVPSPPAPEPMADEALAHAVAVVRVPPAGDVFPLVGAVAARGDALVLAPTVADASFLGAQLHHAGFRVALMPRDWARAAAGGCVVVGARAAAWAPVPNLAAAVVVDEHDETYQEERAPTWNARDVVVERARRAGVPCVLTSPCPSLESLNRAHVLVPSRSEERARWPIVDVIDRRPEPPGLGLYSERLVALVRRARPGARVVCVLNRKGRARLLVCAACAEVARCEICQAGLELGEGELRCRRCGFRQPPVCPSCGGGRLKALRVGVTRAREELERLAGMAVAEVTAEQPVGTPADVAVMVGTEAVLHQVSGAAVVAFLDFDQEVLAPRYRAGEQALALLARAARLVGGRDEGGRLVIQTRVPGHEVIDAAVHGDPERLSVVEGARRAGLRLPPETAMALVSGPAAAEFVADLRANGGVEIAGPLRRSGTEPLRRSGTEPADDRWLVRAPDHTVLCDALAAVSRPPGRLRLEVDPLRA